MTLHALEWAIFFAQCLLACYTCIVLGTLALLIRVRDGLPLLGNLTTEQFLFKVQCIAGLLMGASILLPGFMFFKGVLSGLVVVLLTKRGCLLVEYLRRKWLKLPDYYLKEDWFEWWISLRKQQLVDRPSDINLRLWLAIHYVEKGESEKAIPELQEVLALEPTRLGAVEWITRVYIDYGEPQRAIKEIEAWIRYNVGEDDPIEIVPERHWTWTYALLGLAYCRIGFVDKGIKMCEKAVAVFPSEVASLQALAEALKEARKFELSVARYREALKRSPARGLYIGLASVYEEMGDRVSAVRAIENAIEASRYLIYPEDYKVLIETYQSTGDEANASQWREIFEERLSKAGHWKRAGKEDDRGWLE